MPHHSNAERSLRKTQCWTLAFCNDGSTPSVSPDLLLLYEFHIRRLMSLIDKNLLDTICFAKPKHLCADFQALRKGNRMAWFKDNRSTILAVAHLDTVNPKGLRWSGQVQLDKTLFFSPYLDDRLGAYTILHVLPALGINVDILFTMDEEVGYSTADLFNIDFKYNWIVEFDRRGEDVVCYDYGDVSLSVKLKSVGFDEGMGSYSDICKLQDIGCKAFNVGIGYENEHSARPFFVIETYEKQIAKFVKFHEKFKDEQMPHVKVEKPKWGNKWEDPRTGLNSGIYNYQQENFNYGSKGNSAFGVSSEYDKWSKERDERENRKKGGILSNSDVMPPIPGWCPVCYRKVSKKKCPNCGELSIQEGEYWPTVLSEDAKAQIVTNA